MTGRPNKIKVRSFEKVFKADKSVMLLQLLVPENIATVAPRCGASAFLDV